MTTADLPHADRSRAGHGSWLTWSRGCLIACLLLLVGIAATTTYRSPNEAEAADAPAFDAAKYAASTYEPKIVPAIERDAVDIATLHRAISAGLEDAGRQYGHRAGTGPYSYAVTLTGTAGTARSGLLPVTVPGLEETRVSIQVGPAINGTALRDATGLIDFGHFVNQVDYADAATALNARMKATALKRFDAASVRGKKISVVGAMAPLTADVMTITPVSIGEGS